MGGEVKAIYEELSAVMPTHKVRKGGPELDYITTEACTTRLNTALGPDGWSFRITERWYDAEADECCVRGVLTVHWPSGRTTEHEDIGNQIPNRRRAQDGQQGDIIEIGNDWKGARSDCLKRCATDIGIGLWLYAKQGAHSTPPQAQRANGATRPTTVEQDAALRAGFDPERADLLARVRHLWGEARAAKLRADQVAKPSEDWESHKLLLWCESLEQMLAEMTQVVR